MRFPIRPIVLAGLSVALTACDQEQPAPPPAPPLPVPTATVTPVVAPTTVPAAKQPEDLDIDPVRDPQTRARAQSLNAVRIADMKSLKAGADVVILVRGDKGGGTIYGSGPYTSDSQLRKAVVHAGLVKDRELAIVRLKYAVNDTDHPSVPANGITPTAWGKYHLSYTIEAVSPE